jgi:hypothetical protein
MEVHKLQGANVRLQPEKLGPLGTSLQQLLVICNS